MKKHNYHFDLWAEYLAVSLVENILRCQIGQPVKKIRITFSKSNYWPIKFKVILDNELIAPFEDKTADKDGSYEIEYNFQSPSSIPFGKNVNDPTAKQFIEKAKNLDPNFLKDSWDLEQIGSIPDLLLKLSFRSAIKLIPTLLNKKGLMVSEDLAVQFFDGENYLSFSYDAIRHALVEQSNLYLANKHVRALCSQTCFKHEHNIKWLAALK